VSSEGTVTWRELFVETAEELGSADEARWVCQEASGLEGTAWATSSGAQATEGGVARLDAMLARRRAGEPLQYVLGRWAFRHLDLLVDRRVMIPRPETEQLVDLALALLEPQPPPRVLADLGTGSGVIAFALASELPLAGVTVWATDLSEDALAVARANLAGIGRAAVNVRISAGSWYDALPADLEGRFDLVASNPPYIATDDPAVEESVRGWEPADALFAGDEGLDALRVVVAGAPKWLRPGGALVCEIGREQGEAVASMARGAGLADVRVEPDLAGHDRFLVARRPLD
jgi:release factor glutamine methyltransferase